MSVRDEGNRLKKVEKEDEMDYEKEADLKNRAAACKSLRGRQSGWKVTVEKASSALPVAAVAGDPDSA